MSNNYYPPVRRSRVQQKRRKTNFILNILIFIVFVAILFVGGNILFGSNFADNGTRETVGTPQNEEQSIGKEDEDRNDDPADKSDDSNDGEEVPESNDENGESDDESGSETDDSSNGGGISTNEGINEEGLIVSDSDDPNVITVVINPEWEPIGTVQVGDHVTQYEKGTTDREEMEQALSYAVNIPREDMIVWWLQRGEVPNKNVIGTVSTRDQQLVYRIYLEWVDGEGWMPTKYEELIENDKKQ